MRDDDYKTPPGTAQVNKKQGLFPSALPLNYCSIDLHVLSLYLKIKNIFFNVIYCFLRSVTIHHVRAVNDSFSFTNWDSLNNTFQLRFLFVSSSV